MEGTFSDWLHVTSGVPQGSILGPLLFLVYINDAPAYIQCGSSIALYADDSKLYRPIKLPDASNLLQSGLSSSMGPGLENVIQYIQVQSYALFKEENDK